MEVCLIVLSRLSAANSHDRLIEEPDNRGPDKRGCTVMLLLSQLSVSQSFLEVLWNRTEQNFIRCSYLTSITIRITDTILKKKEQQATAKHT